MLGLGRIFAINNVFYTIINIVVPPAFSTLTRSDWSGLDCEVKLLVSGLVWSDVFLYSGLAGPQSPPVGNYNYIIRTAGAGEEKMDIIGEICILEQLK